MTNQEAIDFIYSSYLKAEKYIPYDEKDALRRSPDLLMSELNDEDFGESTNILVTGSKGKGSTARFIAALLSSIDFFTDVEDPGDMKKNSAIAFQGQQESAVGLVTSPEVLDFTDRIQIVKSYIDSNGKLKANYSNISDEDFVREISEIAPKIKEIDEALLKDKYVSPIGIVALLAQRYFSKINPGKITVQLNARADGCVKGSKNEKKELHIKYKVFECGKGAKYDDTNRIKHEVAVVTPIFLEHRRELGNTVEEIALDKACVVTDDVKVLVSGRQQESVAAILEKKCLDKQAEFFLYGRDFSALNIKIKNGKTVFDFKSTSPIPSEFHGIEIPLLGAFQAENAAVAIETVLAVRLLNNSDKSDYGTEIFKTSNNKNLFENKFGKIEELIKVNESSFLNYLNAVLLSVTYPGRLELLKNNPPIVLDNTINRESAKRILPVLKDLTNEKYDLILSIPDDKDFLGVVQELSEITRKIFIMPVKNPHYKITVDFQKKTLHEISLVEKIDIDEIKNFIDNSGNPVLICGVTAAVKEIHEALD